MSSLAERLRAARRQQMVGRKAERDLFTAAIESPDPPFCFLYLYGPGGIGKTTLLGAFHELCSERQIPTAFLDARYLEPTAPAVEAAVRGALPAGAVRVEPEVRFVLLIDTFERLAALEGWLRDVFFPTLPGKTMIVMAGRHPLAEEWRTDAGWQTLLRSVSLENLTPEECRTLLVARQIPLEHHAAVLEFTHGYPLALSLMTDVFAQQGALPLGERSQPDLVRSLMERLLDDVPTDAHRRALEAAALLRVTTEAALAALIGDTEAADLFAWLSQLSFMDTGSVGVFPHDLARDAILADLRWRNPERYVELHRRARHYFTQRLQEASPAEQQRYLWDYIFLHRDNPVIRGAFTWQESVNAVADSARVESFPVLRAMVEKHEGPESAALFAHWWQHPAHQIQVFRNPASGEPIGFLSLLRLDRIKPEERHDDPALLGAFQTLARSGPLRAGETATHFRFWMARDTYHGVSTVQSLILVHLVRHYLTTPGLTYTFFPVTRPAQWLDAFTYAEMERLSEADFTVGERTYGVFGHDWRRMPPMEWLARLAEKETDPHLVRALTPTGVTAPSLAPMEETAFAAAVREALKRYAEADGLMDNPLLDARFIVERAGSASSRSARAALLKAALRETVEALQAAPRQARAYRVLYHTYIQPAPSQEKAAERLDLPFSTYRRHLMEGIQQIAQTLYRIETGKKT